MFILAPKILPPTFFFFSLSWVLTLRYSEQGAFNAWRQVPGEKLPRCCWADGAREINSVNRVWAETIKSVVPVSLYGAEGCHAQAAVGQLASCAGLRSPVLHKLACFSHSRRRALKQTEKPFSCLWLPWPGAGKQGPGRSPNLVCFVHQRETQFRLIASADASTGWKWNIPEEAKEVERPLHSLLGLS